LTNFDSFKPGDSSATGSDDYAKPTTRTKAPDQSGGKDRTSQWATRHVYFGHFALSDAHDDQFYSFERFSRGSAGLAGAVADPYRVWLENWEAREVGDSVQITATDQECAIDIKLTPEKPLVLQGDLGLSRKGKAPCNVSYYYSRTRLATTGTVKVKGEQVEVRGLSWQDREWSSNSLDKDQKGWDWFSIQLNDGRDLMLYCMRRKDGTSDIFSSGTVVDQLGKSRRLSRNDFSVEVTDHWRSGFSDKIYPGGWIIAVPSENLVLNVKPLLRDQEHKHRFVYWEGAVTVEADEYAVSGHGYAELVGY